MNLKYPIFLFYFIFSSIKPIFSQKKQDKFYVLKVGSKYSKLKIIKAFNSTDLCGYLFTTKQFVITLDDGAEIKLLSKKEIGTNKELTADCFVSDSKRFDGLLWSILPNGSVAIGSPHKQNKSEKIFITN